MDCRRAGYPLYPRSKPIVSRYPTHWCIAGPKRNYDVLSFVRLRWFCILIIKYNSQTHYTEWYIGSCNGLVTSGNKSFIVWANDGWPRFMSPYGVTRSLWADIYRSSEIHITLPGYLCHCQWNGILHFFLQIIYMRWFSDSMFSLVWV